MKLPKLLNILVAATVIAVVAILFFGSQHRAIAAQNNGNGRNNIERITPRDAFTSSTCPDVFAVQYDGKTYLVVRAGNPSGGVAIIEHKSP